MLASLQILAECLVMNDCALCAHHQTGPVVPALHIMLVGYFTHAHAHSVFYLIVFLLCMMLCSAMKFMKGDIV